ncbi:MAG: hypothetical protein ACREJC_05905 [Tepidisphaeraceae bacterium]
MVEERPLEDVVRDLFAKAKQLHNADDKIGMLLARIERMFRERRPTGHPVSVAFPPWGKLAWSGRRGRWRLVVIDGDEYEDLRNMPALCRSDACHVVGKPAKRMNLT